MHYTTVLPQHDNAAHLTGVPCPSGAAFPVVQSSLFGDEVVTLTHAHISPTKQKSVSAISPQFSRSRTFDNGTVHRLGQLKELGQSIQVPDYKLKPPPKYRPDVKPDPNRDAGNCQIWVDGSLIKVSKPSSSFRRSGGGKRNIVLGFSKASRRRLMQKIAQLNRDAKPIFLTLTYPADYPLHYTEWKTDFDKWCKRLHRKYPEAALIWRLEPQKRGAPHFHLLVYGVEISVEFREWLRASWYECVGSGDVKHYHHGTDVEPLRSYRGVRSYVGKYIAKTQAPPTPTDEDGVLLPTPDWSKVGRWWGVRYGDNLPWSRVIGGKMLTYEHSCKLLRYLRRYLKGQGKRVSGSLPGLTVFVNNPGQWLQNFDRLLC